MSRKFDSALDDCLNLLRAGASISDCLARYPEHTEELRPLLALASGVRAVPTPRPDPVAVHANRQRMLAAARAAAARRRGRGWARLARPWTSLGGNRVRPLFQAAITLAAVVLLVGLAAGALFALAADSLPGQALYPVKRFGEDARLHMTLDSARRQELRSEYLTERRREVRQILESGQQAVVEFQGELEEIGQDYWIIGGLKVTLDGDTVVEGHVAAGATVIVRTSSSGDGLLQALRLQVLTNPLLLTPVITSTPTPTVTSTPSSSPAPTATATPTQTATPTPSSTPTATATVTTTPSPLPTDTPSSAPTATLVPTHTEEPEPTDSPEESETEEPEHTDEPEPTEESEPTHTEEP